MTTSHAEGGQGTAPPASATPQEWVDEVTAQGTPPDLAPPSVPGEPTTIPEPTPDDTAPPHAGEGAGENAEETVRVIDTASGAATGLDKCPRCGATEIELRPQTGLLICHFCRHEWTEATIHDRFGLDSPIHELRGMVLGSGAKNIQESSHDVLTLKCGACGAEVVVNTAEAMQSRCHWCRNTLSVNEQLPNGAVPDGLLPFSVTREQAISSIEKFVKDRQFFAHPEFVKQFAASEVVGVYLPYLLVDANVAVSLQGVGEITTRTYTVKRGDDEITLYDADVYRVSRSFDLTADDVTLESSADRANINTSTNTNNIINAIQPFDMHEAVTYNANYLRGFTSEKRDLDVEGLVPAAYNKVLSISRASVNSSLSAYDRQVRWEREHLTVKGTRWVAVYVPVWLYSYQQTSGSGRGLLHYVAVNGRTGKVMGSVPVRQGRLIGISAAIGVAGTILGGLVDLFI